MFDLSKIRELIKKVSILYVEDDKRIREQLVRTFEQLDFDVDTALDGKEGLQMIKQKHYDVVISDTVMPRMDGLTMIKEIKENFPNVKVIITSAYNDEENLQRYRDLGVDGFCSKPFSIAKLINDIISLVQQ